jgi:hypothetical protein
MFGRKVRRCYATDEFGESDCQPDGIVVANELADRQHRDRVAVRPAYGDPGALGDPGAERRGDYGQRASDGKRRFVHVCGFDDADVRLYGHEPESLGLDVVHGAPNDHRCDE